MKGKQLAKRKRKKKKDSSKHQTIAGSGLFSLNYTVSYVWVLFILNFVPNNFSQLNSLDSVPLTYSQQHHNEFICIRKYFRDLQLLHQIFYAELQSKHHSPLQLIDRWTVSPVTLLKSYICRNSVWINKHVREVGSMLLHSANRLLFHHVITLSGGQTSELDIT